MNVPFWKEMCKLLVWAAHLRVPAVNVQTSHCAIHVPKCLVQLTSSHFVIVLPSRAKTQLHRLAKNMNCSLPGTSLVFTLHARNILLQLEAIAPLMNAPIYTAPYTSVPKFNPGAQHTIFWFHFTLKSCPKTARMQSCGGHDSWVVASVTVEHYYA